MDVVWLSHDVLPGYAASTSRTAGVDVLSGIAVAAVVETTGGGGGSGVVG